MSMHDGKQAQAQMCPICGRIGDNLLIEHGKNYVIYRCSYCSGDFARTAVHLDYHGEIYQIGGDVVRDDYKVKVTSSPEKQLGEGILNPEFKYALQFLGVLPAKSKLLDIGCGVGVFPKLADELGAEVYAVDLAEEAIRYARENYELTNALVGTIDDVPPEWQNFDVITSFETLEHIDKPRELAEKIYKCLKPGGYFIMGVPNADRLRVKLRRRELSDYPPNHVIRWHKKTVRIFLTDLGFINIALEIDDIGFIKHYILLPAHEYPTSSQAREIRGISYIPPTA